MRRMGLAFGLVVAVTMIHAVSAWAQSPSPTSTSGSPLGGGGIGSVVAILVLGGLVALLVFYRRRVLEPFTQRYSNPPPEVPPGPRERGWAEPDDDQHGEDRPTP